LIYLIFVQNYLYINISFI
jgi:DNA-binding IclR family transcriptional regulator